MSDVDQLAVNTLRTLAMDAVEHAQSGHPGAPMALAPLAYALWTQQLRHDPAEPTWPDRDRFVLSNGHASMLLYGLLHLTGYDLSLEDIRGFRQVGSRTPGHPEYGLTPGVETTTGPLGQGISTAVGMALAERMLAERFNRPGHEIIDHRTWVIASDGDLMEGVASEACSLAGHLGLEKMVVLWDDNHITIDGSTDLAFSGEEVLQRFAAYGWDTLEVDDANDLDELQRMLETTTKPTGRPTFVRVPTRIAWGAPTKAGTSAAHGAPLGPDEVEQAKAAYGWSYPEPFTVPPEVAEHADQRPRGQQLREEWEKRLSAYRTEHPELADELERRLSGHLPADWDADLPSFTVGEATATRKASGKVINALAGRLPELVGGSADLASSNNTTIADGADVSRDGYDARNIHYGVREHAMAAITNGLTLHGGFRPFAATFLIFSDYMRASLRLAALMGVPSVYVTTHDSIGLGEDGPTHQPVEHLASLRAMPNMHVVRPADATETVGAWQHALTRTDGPTLLALSRQNLPTQPTTRPDGVADGAYTVRDVANPDVILVASGSEVPLALDAAEELEGRRIAARVVSMPCWETFAARPPEEREQVLPTGLPTLSVEAASSFGWHRWSDRQVALDTFGESGPYTDVYAHFGFTPERIADDAAALVDS